MGYGAEMEEWGGVKGQWAAHFRGTSAHPSTLALGGDVATDRPRGRRGVLVASGEAGGGGARLRVVRLPPTNGRTDETRVPWPMVARAP